MSNQTEKDDAQWLSPAAMDRDINVEFRGDHIHVELGKNYQVSAERRGEFWGAIRALCEKYNSRRVLVEGFLPRGERDTSEVVDAGLRTDVIPQLWLAFCFPNFEATEQSELFIAVAASRGARVKFFSEKERALKWLRSNTPA